MNAYQLDSNLNSRRSTVQRSSPMHEPRNLVFATGWNTVPMHNALQLASSANVPIPPPFTHIPPVPVPNAQHPSFSSSQSQPNHFLPPHHGAIYNESFDQSQSNHFLPPHPGFNPPIEVYAHQSGQNTQLHASPSLCASPESLLDTTSLHPSPIPTPSPRSSSGRAPSRAASLQRGAACLHCRRRKTRCDAVKPACGPCASTGKSCEYEISLHLQQIRDLEDEIVQLRARIVELESRSPAANVGPFHPVSPPSHAYPVMPAPTGYPSALAPQYSYTGYMS
ncbi:hypothetical protein BKA62DRAFT_759445 [Auriculariales sp. MPI-PUGE-AT-0066]|nr:hypothetical protein BKA62DRAFT_759445 [Auriculariales sp. MPI-PUGE-AT-0066]